MQNLKEVCDAFNLPADVANISSLGSGLIHQTYRVQLADHQKFVLQEINERVFPDVEALMHNLKIVSGHLGRSQHHSELQSFEIVETRKGNSFLQIGAHYWRMLTFIDQTQSYDSIPNGDIARSCGQAFGRFFSAMHSLDAASLKPVLPDFHDISKSFEQLKRAANGDAHNRLNGTIEVFNGLMEYSHLADDFAAANWPKRVVHGDAKINNILFDKRTRQPVAVIDLDTVMKGYLIFDFGDMVRTFCNVEGEESKTYSKVRVDREIFENLVQGFAEATHSFIQQDEMENLVTGAKMIVWEQAIRFFSDYLDGDSYYQVQHPEQNLDRAKNQLCLLKDLVDREDELTGIVKSDYSGRYS